MPLNLNHDEKLALMSSLNWDYLDTHPVFSDLWYGAKPVILLICRKKPIRGQLLKDGT